MKTERRSSLWNRILDSEDFYEAQGDKSWLEIVITRPIKLGE